MSAQDECMHYGKQWEWKSDNIFDFNLPIGKRICSAVPYVQRNFGKKIKSGEMIRAQLIMEFSAISGRISKKCAAQEIFRWKKLKDFTPSGRGKN